MPPGARPAPRHCDPEAQPQTTSADAAATPTEAAKHTSHRCRPARKSAPEALQNAGRNKTKPPSATPRRRERPAFAHGVGVPFLGSGNPGQGPVNEAVFPGVSGDFGGLVVAVQAFLLQGVYLLSATLASRYCCLFLDLGGHLQVSIHSGLLVLSAGLSVLLLVSTCGRW
ncbi:hypothetical protein NDU88_001311 [Pleurodeles waltl]|uniref:Uncharacterized protein n=1 Tax=Pleurodeles waltl TaxID=8319 RepID=A0AAV7U6P1_PLEWA|nr:hypothetical protein NDU88_001311 [Pleurodeles waltl]